MRRNKSLYCASNLILYSTPTYPAAAVPSEVSGVSLVIQSPPNPPVHRSWFMSPETTGAAGRLLFPGPTVGFTFYSKLYQSINKF